MLANDPQACGKSARQVLGDSEMPTSFPSLDGTARACACAPSKVARNFPTIKFCDLTLVNDSHACRESPRQVLGDSKTPRSFSSLDGTAVRAHACPQKWPETFWQSKFAIQRLLTICKSPIQRLQTTRRLAASLHAKF